MINNKFDMLDAMGGIDEEYVRKADKLLARYQTGGETAKMEITPVKFSWRPIAAAAACLAVLIGGTLGLRHALGGRIAGPNVTSGTESGGSDVISRTDESLGQTDEYLERMASLFGARCGVSYAKDKTDITEFEVPAWFSAAGSENAPHSPVFADKNRLIVERLDNRGPGYPATGTDNEGYAQLGMYNIESGEYVSLHGRSDDPEMDAETKITAMYANADYAVFDMIFYSGYTCKKRELRVAELAADGERHNWYTAYVMEGESVDRDMAIVGDTLYFRVSGHVSVNSPIYRYEIGGGKAEQIASGSSVAAYNGRAYYIRDSEYDPVLGQPSDIEVYAVGSDAPIASEKIGGGKKPAVGSCGIFSFGGADNSLVNLVTGQTVLSGGTQTIDSAEILGFGVVVNGSAVYSVNENALLVFGEDDFFENARLCGFSHGICAFTEDGGKTTLRILTETLRIN